jgi:hypothetical protein
MGMPTRLSAISDRTRRSLWDLQEEFARVIAYYSGPPYKPDQGRIVIDVTNACNLNCFDCNRSCGQGQAMSIEHLSLDQIRRFIQESVTQNRKWKQILIEGGEPTLHPDLLGIVDLLLGFKRAHSPRTLIQVNSNGYHPDSNEVLARLPGEIGVYRSSKRSNRQEHHARFNVAPVDLPLYAEDPFSNGCFLPARYGIGLVRYGYYPHPVCGNIDRVFGFDVGRKSLPSADDRMVDQFQTLCRYCGHYRECNPRRLRRPGSIERIGAMSPAWIRAYAEYKRRRPLLSQY